MKLPLYQIDAFTDRAFGGNPAAICPLGEWLDDDTMQKMALENNLSETAFFVGGEGRYDLRWFTPAHEVDLCGHATLASAHVVFNRLEPGSDKVVFSTKSGDLMVTRQGDLMEMNFPSRPPSPVASYGGLLEALGGNPGEVMAARDYMVTYETADDVRALAPDMAGLASLDKFAIIVTAPGDGTAEAPDFVSRFFAPAGGIPEDPVTGSAHCTLIPYWSKRLGKSELTAHQISPRGGVLHCRDEGDRVTIAGNAVEVLAGEFFL